MATPETPQHASKASNGEAFRRWRQGRPFWGGLLMVLSGGMLFLSANLRLGDIEVHFGPEGFLSYLIPALMLACGVLVWVTPQVRLFYGVIGTIVAVYSLIGLNLGGFFIGLLLGIIGGALVLAWTPRGLPKAAEPAPGVGPAPGDTAADDTVTMDRLFDKRSDDPGSGPTQPIAVEYQTAAEQPAGSLRPSAGSTGEGPLPGEDPGEPGKGRHRSQMFVAALLAGGLTAALLTAGAPPVRAQAAPSSTECPPSAAAALRKAGRPQAPKAQKAPRSTRTAAKPKAPSADDDAGDPAPATTGPSATPTPSGSPSGNPIVDGWNDFVEDVEDFFNGDATPTPSASGEPTVTPSPSGAQPPQPAPSDPAKPPTPGDPKPEPSATTAIRRCPASANASSSPPNRTASRSSRNAPPS